MVNGASFPDLRSGQPPELLENISMENSHQHYEHDVLKSCSFSHSINGYKNPGSVCARVRAELLSRAAISETSTTARCITAHSESNPIPLHDSFHAENVKHERFEPKNVGKDTARSDSNDAKITEAQSPER